MENVKKEKYTKPDVDLLQFETNDIITTSGFLGEEDNFVRPSSNSSVNTENELPEDTGAGNN